MSRARELRFVPADEVPRLLSMEACIEAVEDAFRSLARGGARQPLRTVIPVDDEGSSFLAMPAALEHPPALGAKLLTLFPPNHGTGVPSHQGLVILFDPEHGTPVAVVDAAPVTAIRTAAASAVATRALARDDAAVLAVLGSGVQARTHVEAMRAVRPVRQVRAWSPNRERLESFVREMAAAHPIEVRAANSPRAAVEGASLVCTVTSSPEPVLAGSWLAPGAHVNAVGASTPTTRELDSEAVRRSRFWVDRLESARAEAGDLLLAVEEGAVGPDHVVGELGDVLVGRAPGRESPHEITVFKSLGLAVQDLAAVSRLLSASGPGPSAPPGGSMPSSPADVPG